MNTSNTNSGGWENSYMRKMLLGNIDIPALYPSDSFFAVLPYDLRAVMKSVTKYTDNTGNASNVSGNVTATTDYLWLLAEFEVQGTRSYANQYEQNYQAQYQYYKSGNSKVAYKHSATSSNAYWWLRSAHYTVDFLFCDVYADGSANSDYPVNSRALLPCFAV